MSGCIALKSEIMFSFANVVSVPLVWDFVCMGEVGQAIHVISITTTVFIINITTTLTLYAWASLGRPSTVLEPCV